MVYTSTIDSIFLSVYDTNTRIYTKIQGTDFPSDYMVWTPNGESIVWADLYSLYKTNINSMQTTIVRQGCQSYAYLPSDISSDGKQILAIRTDRKRHLKTGIKYDIYPVLIDIDGKNEFKLGIE